jgi:hypothetical protein
MKPPHVASAAERGQRPGPDPAGVTPVLPPLPSDQNATERAREREQRAEEQKQKQAEEFNREHTRLKVNLDNAMLARDKMWEAPIDLTTLEAALASIEVYARHAAATALVATAQAALDSHRRPNPYR